MRNWGHNSLKKKEFRRHFFVRCCFAPFEMAVAAATGFPLSSSEAEQRATAHACWHAHDDEVEKEEKEAACKREVEKLRRQCQ